MKVRTILLSMALVAGVSLNASAQFKIGGKSINTKKLVNAASDAAKAVTLSDEDVAAMALASISSGWIRIMRLPDRKRRWGSVWQI